MSDRSEQETTEIEGHEAIAIPDEKGTDFDINAVRNPCWICGRNCESSRFAIFAYEGMAISWEKNPSDLDFPGLASSRSIGSECRKRLPDRFVLDREDL